MPAEKVFGEHPDYVFNKIVDEAIYKALETGNAYSNGF